jgi:hypothetical protein
VDGTPLEARTEAIGSAALADLTFDVYSHVIRSFGPSRCMFESNFPVDKVCISYKVFWNCAKLVSQRLDLSDADKVRLLGAADYLILALPEFDDSNDRAAGCRGIRWQSSPAPPQKSTASKCEPKGLQSSIPLFSGVLKNPPRE